ncbi:MAG: peptidylprolyl isomerase [Saprospiraceae bacterium]|nr:peptidylprolyl isomerase [Saprospiraceae bacterium]
MITRILIFAVFVFVAPFMTHAQSDDPVLFTVEGNPVHISEFKYIYNKTNGQNADYSKKSVEEYLDLYVQFKLKVQKAKEMQLDTIPQLKSELEGYRRQLADSYLIDKEVTEKLIKEVYERSKEDVDISQIFFQVPNNASEAQEKAAYDKAVAAKKRLDAGEDFATVAKEVSEDRSAPQTGGRIGFVTALFPNGFYPLETAAYSQETGAISDPIRTNAGYHILKVHGRRPARGEMEAAHILIRSKDKGEEAAKQMIDSIYQVLQKEDNFEDLARRHSEDKRSARNGGSIGFFGINKYDRVFEDAAFSLEKDGQYTKPVKTAVGWHIIKRISKKGLQPYNIERSRIRRLVEKDMRYQEAQDAMLADIKKEANFTEYPEPLKMFIDSLPDTFTTFKWRAEKDAPKDVIFTLGKKKVTIDDYSDYLAKSQRERLRLGRTLKDIDKVAMHLYDSFVKEQSMKFEEARLEEKYPEFKALMREYEEGILLFEATKIKVWDKASQDTAGLEKFYETIKGKYRWDKRAVVDEYRVNSSAEALVSEIAAFAANNSAEAVRTKYNTPEKVVVVVNEKTYEKGRNNTLDAMEWKVGEVSEPTSKGPGKFTSFLKIKELLSPADKTLAEARGYVVADYQDLLNTEWVEKLKKEYKVKINEKVLKDLIQD